MSEARAIAGAIHDNLTGLGWRKPRVGDEFALVRDHGHRAVRVEIVPSEIGQAVLTTVSWVNMATGTPVIGQQTLQVQAGGNMDDTIEAIRSTVLRCLVIYRDVLTGDGVASNDAMMAQVLREEQDAMSTVIDFGEGE